MIPILYIVGKILLIAILLISSFALIYLVIKSFTIKRELKIAEADFKEKLYKDCNIYYAISNFITAYLIKKTTQATFNSPWWLKLVKSTPLAKWIKLN